MKLRAPVVKIVALLLLASGSRSAVAQLYSQNFDVDNQATAWSVNAGPTDENVNTFFDYSTVGIPSAPNSTGGSTRGMKLQANLTAGVAGGVNVSPIGKSFTGDYALRFDLWSNFIGAELGQADPLTDGIWEGGVSSTKLSNFGILSSGAGENYQTASRNGVAEALYFGGTGDGQTGLDYRIHGPGNPATNSGPGGFRATVETTSATPFNNWDAVRDAGVSYADTYPTGHPNAGKTNRGAWLDPTVPFDPNNVAVTDGFLYQAAFPSVSAPGQAALYGATQFDSTMPGAMGMAWRQMEIKKVGNIVTWSVLNGGVNQDTVFLLATVDLSLLQVPATSGTNIMFGEADPSLNVGTDPDFAALQFTLIDNVRVEVVAPTLDADFDNDGDADGADFLTWQRGLGLSGGAATNAAGNANGDTVIDGADLTVWKGQFPPSTVVAAAVPEPASWGLLLVAAGCVRAFRRSNA